MKLIFKNELFGSVEKVHVMNDDQLLPEEIVNSVVNVYNECVLRLNTNLENEVTAMEKMNDEH